MSFLGEEGGEAFFNNKIRMFPLSSFLLKISIEENSLCLCYKCDTTFYVVNIHV